MGKLHSLPGKGFSDMWARGDKNIHRDIGSENLRLKLGLDSSPSEFWAFHLPLEKSEKFY